jgi:sec-independent protein translocase protein TatC
MTEEKDVQNEMPFLDHLEELRWRIVRSFIAVFVLACAAFVFKDIVFDKVLFGPLNADFLTYAFFCSLSQTMGLGDKLCFGPLDFTLLNFKMSGQFMTHIMVSFVAGIIVAFPYIFWEFWAFLKPGLRSKERKMANGRVLNSTILFSTVVLNGYYMIAP